MAYNGYLLKIGSYTFPMKLIEEKSYKVTKSTQDLDSYRDADMVLHRNAVARKIYKIDFNTLSGCNNTAIDSVMQSIRSQFTVPNEKKCNVTFYVPETAAYETMAMYMPDMDFTIDVIKNNKIYYDSLRFAFISY